MKKYLLSLLIICLSLLLIVGCGSNTTEETTDTSTDKETTTEDTTSDVDYSEDIIGEWQADEHVENFTYQGTTYTGEDVFTYTFNEDGTYKLVASGKEEPVANADENADDVSSGMVTYEGDYSLDGDQLTLSVTSIDGQTRDEYQATNPENTDVVLYEDTVVTIKIDGDTMDFESDETNLTFKKVEANS